MWENVICFLINPLTQIFVCLPKNANFWSPSISAGLRRLRVSGGGEGRRPKRATTGSTQGPQHPLCPLCPLCQCANVKWYQSINQVNGVHSRPTPPPSPLLSIYVVPCHHFCHIVKWYQSFNVTVLKLDLTLEGTNRGIAYKQPICHLHQTFSYFTWIQVFCL